jgi:hypothetical protein
MTLLPLRRFADVRGRAWSSQLRDRRSDGAEVASRMSTAPGSRVGVVVVGMAVAWILFGAIAAPTFMGRDYGLYMDATRRWLGGGSFYLPITLAGPYSMDWGQILYPPQALALFVPFAVLPAWLSGPLWVLIPSAVTLFVIASHRPRAWAWAAILVLLLLSPSSVWTYLSGTPTIWIVAFVAAATRWPVASALVWIKPSLAPFALLGMRRRPWWLVTAVLAVAGLAMWPLLVDWVNVVANARGSNSGLWYSLENVPLLTVPILAWVGRTRAPRLDDGQQRAASNDVERATTSHALSASR